MRPLEIKGITGTSRIFVGEKLENLSKYIPAEKFVIITDTNVGRIYRKDFPPCEVIEIGTGEKIKTLDTVQRIYEQLLDLAADRSVFVIGIGGGIVCDIAGFVASTYMRGVRFGFVSSTLLAQVDASVGGKNGVNFHGYKNMIGNFNQPEFVICDMNLLKTLPEREVSCGFGEIAKHAFIGSADMCDYIEKNFKRALDLDEEVISKLVYDSVVIKSSIVSQDEKEKGERKKLNFGHTFGHAIEKTTNALLHGEAISVGMVVASKLSSKRGLLSTQDVKRIEKLLLKLELPITLYTDKEKMVDAIKKDKKKIGDDIDFVLLGGIGNAVLEKISIKDLEDAVFDL
ncbi:MAG: 3-dehydroquinate synthase [Deltaproteobacteria bacterium]|nr:3-dehydroquinate synthase [Deltaproteobacteria bacterium]